MYAKWLKSYRESPQLYKQWCSVVIWEKTTRPFLRTSEFLWQEGHTLHETYEEAEKETLDILQMYKELCEELIALPVIDGQKSESEKFAGGERTYTIAAMMHDGKALQSGTSHFLGQHFTKAFDITFADREGGMSHPYHTSWGISTRLIGGLIMTHSDNRGLVLPPRIAPTSHFLGQHFTKAFDITFADREGGMSHPYHTSWGISTRLIGGLIMTHSENRGLVLPPRIAPTQVMIIPIAANIAANKGGVMEKVDELYAALKEKGARVEVDDRPNYSTGYKLNDSEMKGIPVRIEIGPKDIENNQAMVFRRETLEKEAVSLDNLVEYVTGLFDTIHNDMLEKARKHRENRTSVAKDMTEFKAALEDKPAFIQAMWCGCPECEAKITEETTATIRCIPFEQEDLGTNKCVYCGKEAKDMVIIAKAY